MTEKRNLFNFSLHENAVLPGEICKSCIHLVPSDGIPPCPWGNGECVDGDGNFKTTMFVGEDGSPGSLCDNYKTYDDIGVEMVARQNSIRKTAEMTDSQLNVQLYKKIMALNEKERKKLFGFWDYIYPTEYAKQMVGDKNETEQKKPEKKKGKQKTNKFPEEFKTGKEK
jgi:hypothetical protein